MADEVELEYSILNVAATPHRTGAYRTLFGRIAGKQVRFRGQDSAAITPPILEEDGLFRGRVLVWTDLDPDAPAIDKRQLTETTLQEAEIDVPQAFGINGRTFFYAFRERDHRLFYESRNEFRVSLGPASLKRILDRLFATREGVQVEVTIEPEDDALERILAIPIIRTLTVELTTPNPDDNEKEAEEVLNELEEQNAKEETIILKKKPGKKGLKLNKRTLAKARVAASNGSVSAVGTDSARKIIKMSTEEYPKKVLRRLGALGTVATLLRVARDTVIRRYKEN